uniref:Elongation of very long chain fatty acids protein n=1 Tax=Buteo japonicus TaxID=224669 RepID=A0A8C0BU03_9AVES
MSKYKNKGVGNFRCPEKCRTGRNLHQSLKTDPWPLVHSPFPVTLLFAFYLLVVALGPFYMRPRKPLKLRGLLVAYNLAMMMLSSYMFYEVRRQDWLLGLRAFPCAAQQMARVCWWFFFSKVIELLDTVFFILRKKQEQVTFLHVYHHGTMLFNWWSGVKYVPGGQAFFIGMLNSFVHIFMYGYYALASLGPRMHPYLWWKRYLTIMQLVISSMCSSLHFCTSPFSVVYGSLFLSGALKTRLDFERCGAVTWGNFGFLVGQEVGQPSFCFFKKEEHV